MKVSGSDDLQGFKRRVQAFGMYESFGTGLLTKLFLVPVLGSGF